jgi:hypothetical protein
MWIRISASDVPADFLHSPNHLVTRRDRQPPSREISLRQLEVRPTGGAGDNSEDDLTSLRVRVGQLDQ